MSAVEDRKLVCARCGRTIERCAMCEDTRCANGICYADLAFALRISSPPLHAHGG